MSGVTFDSREVQSGDFFVAMPGTIHDGHRFVDGAFAAGAAGAIVAHRVNGPHVRVDDTFAALQALLRGALRFVPAVLVTVMTLRLLGQGGLTADRRFVGRVVGLGAVPLRLDRRREVERWVVVSARD